MARKINFKIEKRELPYKLYYFVCEDAESMQHYLDGLKKKYAGQKIVIRKEKARDGNDIKSVVKSSIDKRDEIEQKRETYSNGYEVIACFDKDNNKITDIYQEINKINNEDNVEFIYNNPCYEYWILLHTKQTSRGFTSSDQCCREAMKAINSHYHQSFEDLDKFKSAENIFNIVGQDLPKAIQNAKSLNFTDDDLDGTYTNAHLVLEEIIKMAE